MRVIVCYGLAYWYITDNTFCNLILVGVYVDVIENIAMVECLSSIHAPRDQLPSVVTNLFIPVGFFIPANIQQYK